MTAQMHEKLIYEGTETSMAFCPPLPKNHPQLRQREDTHYQHTACWRGYVGTWELRRDHLFLNSIEGSYELTGEPIHAIWFSGVLRIPKGQLLQYVHMGFGSVYEEEIHVKIVDGLVTKERCVDHRQRETDAVDLGLRNLPGNENQFEGDDEL
jgi:hypothetical protein